MASEFERGRRGQGKHTQEDVLQTAVDVFLLALVLHRLQAGPHDVVTSACFLLAVEVEARILAVNVLGTCQLLLLLLLVAHTVAPSATVAPPSDWKALVPR